MTAFDNRSEERKKTCLQAFASDLGDSSDVKCIIRDVNRSGCMIVTSQLHELPELIQLVPENFTQPLNGRIVWRKDKQAGVAFISPASDEVYARLREVFLERVARQNDGEPLLLECSVRPLGYAERLARYAQRPG